MTGQHILEDALREHRQLLWGVCYRMLGCPADADDALQSTLEKALQHGLPALVADSGEALPLRPWLLRIAMNHCRDELRKRQTRESAFWLPGPLETPDDDPRFLGSEAPDARYSRMESLSLAFMVALHTLTPLQRSVLILRDVLDLSVAETAEALETTSSNVKMALHRARAQLAKGPVTPPLHDRVTEERVLKALLVHLATHNVAALTELLSGEVSLCNDADPDQVAAHRVIVGRDKVLMFQFKTARSGRFALRLLNGQPALVVEVPPMLAPSSGREVGKPARETPRYAVMWIELDASGKVVAMHLQTSRRKLAQMAFDTLQGPQPLQLAAAAWAALSYPRPSRWLPSATRAAARSLVRKLSQR